MQTSADNPSISSPDELSRTANETGSATINRLAGTAHQTVDRIAQQADSTLQSLRGRSETWKATSDESLEHVYEYVRERPLMALGMAAAAGFLLSRLMR